MSNGDATAEAEIRQLAQEWMDAVARRDAVTLDSLMADDFILASGMGIFIEKPEWLDMALRRIVAKSFRYSNVRVRVYGEEEFAVMQSWWSQQATIDGREWDGEGLMTDVWVKQEGRWRVVARHSSVPPPQAS
jgi:uncharacterized protein (TIGR02246 family)